jgi:hypothetical protein
VRLELTRDGRSYVVSTGTTGFDTVAASGSLMGATCATNYPAATVVFPPSGFPMAVDNRSRAGSFVVSDWGVHRTVTVQLGGVIRWY